MGKLEELEQDPKFRRIEKILTGLAHFLYADKVGGPLEVQRTKVYRILTSPLEELELWEKYGGYDPEKSIWSRFVGTTNRYLAYMMKLGLRPAWLHKPEVMIEIHHVYPQHVKYAEAAVGNVPTVRGERLDDVYVSQQDLALFECWIEWKVGIDEIKRFYVDEEASEEVKKRVKEFAEKYKIPIEWKFPKPSDDDKTYEWHKPSEYGVTDDALKELVDFLIEREQVCRPWYLRPIPDTVVAALAEALDRAYYGIYPLGASDAISVRNERLRKARYLFVRPPEPECECVTCKSSEESSKTLKHEETLSKVGGSMLKLKGAEAWKYDTLCALCVGVIGADEDVYVIGAHVFHENCLEWLLSQSDEKFNEVLKRLPLDTHEELKKLRREKKGGVEKVMKEAAEKAPGPGVLVPARILVEAREVVDEVKRFKRKLFPIFHAIEEHDWARLEVEEFKRIIEELQAEAKQLEAKYPNLPMLVDDLKWDIKGKNVEGGLRTICHILFYIDPVGE